MTTRFSLLHDSHETSHFPGEAKERTRKGPPGTPGYCLEGMGLWNESRGKTLEFMKGKALQQGISRRNKVQGKKEPRAGRQRKKRKLIL